MAKFLFVRHGETDYSNVGEWANTSLGILFSPLSERGREQILMACRELKEYKVDVIVSSPYTRTMQGAAIMARELNAEVFVEKDLHEWQSDLSYSITDSDELLKLCQDHDRNNGIWPRGQSKLWESTEMVKERVLNCLSKYDKYDCVVVSAHAMMMQAVLGLSEPIANGQVLEL